MKKIISALLALTMLFALSACGEKTDDKSSSQGNDAVSTSSEEKTEKLDTKCNVYGLNGPTGMGLVSLMDKKDNGKAGLDYSFNMVGSNDEIVAKIMNGEADIAAVATNLASVLYKKTNGAVSVLAVNTLGVLCVVTKGEEVKDIKDLKGKTVYTTGQGANPEYIINYILEKNGLKAGEDVKIEFVAQPTELVTTVVSNENAIVIAPQPVATSITVKDSAASIAIDLNNEWEKVSDTKLVMGCIIARNDYISQNPDAVKMFMKEYKQSIEDVNKNKEASSALCEKYSIVSPAAVALKALPYCNIVFEDGKELKTDLSAYLQFLFDKSPASVGGEMPKDNFYYEAK